MSITTIIVTVYAITVVIASWFTWRFIREESTSLASDLLAAAALALVWPLIIALAAIFGPPMRAIGRFIDGLVRRW